MSGEEANHDDLLAQFQAISGADLERSRFYLESANWKLDLAISAFYEDPEANEAGAGGGAEAPKTGDQAASADAQSKPKSGNVFASFKTDNSDSSSEEEGQAFFAGGSSTSGQQILGPPKKKNGANLVKEMFQRAKDAGAEVVSGESSGSSRSSARTAFSGSAYRLGSEPGEGQSTPVQGAAGGQSEASQPKEVVLKMWANGFTVDDGELRAYDDPANREFLVSITTGQLPRELLRGQNGREVLLNMEDHKTEDYVKPKASVKPFQGQGQMLGSVAPTVAAPAANEGDNKSGEQAAQERFPVDSSAPSTTVQVRLNDGSRLVVKLNQTHTVGNLREYVTLARPHLAAQAFTLATTFPNKVLEDDTQSLKDAGLLNTAVVLRLK